jgi:hypothetical protein
MSIDNVTIHQGYELPNGTNTLAHDVTRLINALTSVDSDVFLRPLASSSTYVGTTAIALNRASAAQSLTGITSIDGSAATLTTSRTLWGQSFNGSANVTGNLTSVGNITGSGAISLTTAAASNLSLTSGTTGVVSLDSGTTGAINIGTGANTKTITIGSSTGTVQLPTAVTKVGQTSLIQGGAVNVTFPTLAGTLVGSGDTGTVTATMLASTTGTGSTVVLSTLPTFGTTGVKFSGSTSGTTTLLASATASGTLTLPAVTGTVVTTGDTGSVTSTMILDGTILNADVNASAAIAGTKISPDFGSQNCTSTGTSTAASFIPTSATVPTNGLYLSAANTVALATNNTGRVFVDSSGRLLVGTSTSRSNWYNTTGLDDNLQIEGTTHGGSGFSIVRSNNFGGHIELGAHGGTTIGSYALVSSGANLGSISFQGADGTEFVEAASIYTTADGTPGANNMPGRLVFSTTASGSAASTERMRITSAGTVNIVGAGTAGSTQAVSFNGSAPVNSLVLDSSGKLGVGTNAPNAPLEVVGSTDADQLRITQSGTYYRVGRVGASGLLQFYGSQSGFNGYIFGGIDGEFFRINANGRVGIGVSVPSYQLQLSTDSAGKPSTNTWTIVSDERIKEDIELADLDLCYEAIKTIPLKRYKWRDDVYSNEQVTDRRKLGWIAQDVETVFPKAVSIHEFKYNQVFEEIIIPAVEEEVDAEGNIITSAQPECTERGKLISEDVIEDCKDLNADQIYAAMYGAIQKLIAKVETLETEVAQLKD